MKTILSWSRDSHGKVIDRHPTSICNAITTMSGGGHSGPYGLGNTTPYVMEVYENHNIP